MAFTLETERLELRLRGPVDAECNMQLKVEQEVGWSLTLAEEQQRLAAQRSQALHTGIGLLGVQRRVERDRIGYCGLVVGRSTFDEPELAYELVRRVHGQGYATEAAGAVLEAAFATGRRRIWATVRAWNTASFRVLDKLGFSQHHCLEDERGELVYLVRDVPSPERT